MPKRSFYERLQPYIGGLVRVCGDVYWNDVSLLDKIGLLLSASAPDQMLVKEIAKVKLLIDGSVLTLYVTQKNLELIGAENAS
jgi:hypothetical protein